jgi:hypothetical protein
MAEQKIYIGSTGPFLYDDADPIDDVDGDLAGQDYKGIATTGSGYFGGGLTVKPLRLPDTDDSNLLSIYWNEDDTADRILNILLSGADRTLTLSGNSALDQDLTTLSTPTLIDLILSTPTYTMFNLTAPGANSVPQWNIGTSVWEWITAGISDLSSFTTDDLAEGSTNLYFPGFTDLSIDYGFTDNSSDWDTAYGWGDHSTIDGTTADTFTVNNDLQNVTSKFIMGRTTGGNAEISWNGSAGGIVLNTNLNLSQRTGAGSELYLHADTGYDPAILWCENGGAKWLTRYDSSQDAFEFYSYAISADILRLLDTGDVQMLNGALLVNAATPVGSEKLRVNGAGYFDGALTAASYADNTPWFEGDAITEIMKIKGKDGKIDHESLPEFLRTKRIVYKNNKFVEELTNGRDIGNNVSMLNLAVQQLYNEFQSFKSQGVRYV